MGDRNVDDVIERLRARERELEEIQALVHLGSWNWDVPRNIVTWSDELYRIYGLDPQSFEATYEGFLERVHPDDQKMVDETVRAAFGSGAPFSFYHRTVRPDGAVRWLHARGEVVQDEAGNTIRMFGTGVDVTEQRVAEESLARSERRFRSTMESAPDAVVGVDATGRIVLVNERTEQLFGYARDELLGQRIEMLLPERVRDVHVSHRATYMADPRTRPMGSSLDLSARRKDVSEFPVDVSLSTVETDEGPLVTAFIRDITERKRDEKSARMLHDAQVRRRQALEINDSVVQGIASAVYALETGEALTAVRALTATLRSARQMMADLLAEETQIGLSPGDLIRAHPASVVDDLEEAFARSPYEQVMHADPIRVLVADDTPDIRTLLRSVLSPNQGFQIVAEVENGAEAILLAKTHRPDAVLLDLAMPVMDGLQALPRIKAVSPDSKIVVLSGYGKGQAEAEALRLGAVAYVEKGGSAIQIRALLHELCPREHEPVEMPAPRSLEEQLELGPKLEMALAVTSHELTNLVTVIRGLAATLLDRIDELPSPVVRELLITLGRNADQMQALIETLADARLVGNKVLTLVIEAAEIGAVVRQAVADLAELTKGHETNVTAPAGIRASFDVVRIRQVLANLLSNAAKFSSVNAPIEVSVAQRSDRVEVAVTDHGPGVPPERAHELFERFTRLTDSGRGLGLGLFISRGIATAHGGDLHLAATSGTGSTFVLSLPLEPAAKPRDAKAG